MKNTHLLIIDPQKDFCQRKNPDLAEAMLNANDYAPNPDIEFVKNGGSLYVSGADEDMERLAHFINIEGWAIKNIHVTLDSHRTVAIFHPIFWIDKSGCHPKPFTLISEKDVTEGVWQSFNPKWQEKAEAYVRTLAKNGRYSLVIWPPHCIIGSNGHSIVSSVSDALIKWENMKFGVVDYISKGSNIFTENYSVYKAEVPEPSDYSTLPNTILLDSIKEADEVWVSGEALDYCVANTVRDLVNDLPDGSASKFVLLRDTTSSVGSPDGIGELFISEMVAKGMKVKKTAELV